MFLRNHRFGSTNRLNLAVFARFNAEFLILDSLLRLDPIGSSVPNCTSLAENNEDASLQSNPRAVICFFVVTNLLV